jgi:hypothetical protein
MPPSARDAGWKATTGTADRSTRHTWGGPRLSSPVPHPPLAEALRPRRPPLRGNRRVGLPPDGAMRNDRAGADCTRKNARVCPVWLGLSVNGGVDRESQVSPGREQLHALVCDQLCGPPPPFRRRGPNGIATMRGPAPPPSKPRCPHHRKASASPSTQAVRHAMDRAGRERHHRPPLLHTHRSLGDILGGPPGLTRHTFISHTRCRLWGAV